MKTSKHFLAPLLALTIFGAMREEGIGQDGKIVFFPPFQPSQPSPPPAAFTPSSIGGLLVWHKADALGLADAAPISTFTDSSGHANNLTQTSTLRPVFKTGIQNGHGVVRFDGVDDYMLWGTALSPADCTIFVVFAATGTIDTAGQRALFSLSSLTPPYGTIYLGDFSAFFTGETLTFANISAGPVIYGAAHTASFSGWNIWAFRLNGTAETIFKNDASQSLNISSFASGHMDSSGTRRFLNVDTLGAFGTAAPFAGDVGEIIVYDFALSDPDVARVDAYLKAKWATP